MSADHAPPADVELTEWPGRDHGVSVREGQVMALVTEGLGDDEIADLMLVSANAVKSYARSACRKIGVDRRRRAILWRVGTPVHHVALPAADARVAGSGLLDALQEWRDPTWTVASECHVPERRMIDANRATVERAKDALVRRYGIDALRAFSLMVRWARLTHTPVHTLAMTLVQDGEADPQADGRDRSLIRWLDEVSCLTSNHGSESRASGSPGPCADPVGNDRT